VTYIILVGKVNGRRLQECRLGVRNEAVDATLAFFRNLGFECWTVTRCDS
jgi:hypothetical protein